MIMQSLIIHMSRATQRRANADRLLTDLPNAQLVEAVDGRDPAQITGISVHGGDLFRPHYPFALRPTEIGVFLSHRKCWQMILDKGWEAALIVEDDLRVDPDGLARSLSLLDQHMSPDMVVRLPVKAREVPGSVLGVEGETRFILPRVIGLQCVAMVVGRQAAARLLEITKRIDRPVDTFLQMHWVTGQQVHAILPNGNQEVARDIGGSTIQTKTPEGGRLGREIKRAVYRAQVNLRPQTG